MRILLITNYREDRQKSMIRFGTILLSNHAIESNCKVEELYPQSFFNKISPSKRWKKWAAYLDKYLIFPKKIKHKLQNISKPIDLIHVIDHSNSVYLPQLKRFSQTKKIITCHDLIAVRAANGEFSHAPKTSRSGKRLQKWIHNSLKHADYYACDSRHTKQDLTRLVPGSELNSAVLHLGTETNFSPKAELATSLQNFPFHPSKTNYFLHVGSAAWYKNRKAVFTAFRNASKKFPNLDLRLILVGPKPQNEELDPGLSNWFQSHPNSLICLKNLSENSLCELYKHAKALIFPSHIEGFGWPPLEAAVHGCPVITTRTGALSDLLSDFACYIDCDVQTSINQAAIEVLQSPNQKNVSISLPSHNDCRERYYDLYDHVIKH
jgi:glycosyltransferase involved in cell wall biosynthesis